MRAWYWAAIYLARLLEWCRIWWNTLTVFGIFKRWAVTHQRHGRVNCYVNTRLGMYLTAVMGWAGDASRALTVYGNRGLPPLPPDTGFLARLFPHHGDLTSTGYHPWQPRFWATDKF